MSPEPFANTTLLENTARSRVAHTVHPHASLTRCTEFLVVRRNLSLLGMDLAWAPALVPAFPSTSRVQEISQSRTQ